MEHHSEVFLTIVYPTADDENGFHIDGSTNPVSVSQVLPQTPAAIAGLLQGDLLVMVNGHNVSDMSLNKVLSIISYCRCSPITIKVLRPSNNERPLNQKKFSSREETCNYKDTVQNAFDSALDAVSVLSGDFSPEKVPKKINTPMAAVQPHSPLDVEYSMEGNESEEYSQAELLSKVLTAQHGLKDIMKSLNQLKDKSNKEETPSETNVSFKGHLSEASAELSIGRSSDSAPPIPVYNPETPDMFLLSNKPEYQVEVKRQRHYYEQVELDNEPVKEPVVLKPVHNIHQMNSTPFMKGDDDHHIERHNDPLRANKGLPSNVHVWKTEHVLKWLKQLSPSLFEAYKDQFCHHDITGHTLLHFSQSKLQSLGVTDDNDRLVLGMSIAKLRLKTECKELQKLSDHESLALI